MKKVEFVEALAERTGLTKADATRALEGVFDIIKEALVKGDKVPVAGFGTFSVGKRAAREGRNPQTGETVKIAACNSAKFKAASALKEAIN
ncbi:MAG: HU family DNA-binding protein [Bacilli bacterium]|nr:HU family DNA-binding protein [Bacilli bacterium]